jgi:hypothetical protein
MLALLLQCCAFALFAFIGYGLAVALVPERDSLRNALLAPVLGAAALTVPSVLLNHVGLRVAVFAWPLTLLLVAGAGAAIYVRRERCVVPWRALLPFLALLPLALVLTCRPELEFGTNWMSFTNEDMINYAADAQRLQAYGFYAQPGVFEVAGGGRLSEEGYWFQGVMGNERVGVDTLLALLSSLSGMRPFNAFMPVIGAGYFMLIWATAALGLARERRVRLALCIGAATVLSSLTTLGFLSQLLGQIFGLAGCVGAIALLGEPNPETVRSNPFGQIGLRVAVSAFVVAAYPELFPFVVLAMLLEHFVVPVLERKRPDFIAGSAALLSCALAFLVLWNYGRTMAQVIADRFHSATAPAHEILFPYFLLPSGAANFWGLVKLADYPPDPWMSLAIVAGIVLLLVQVGAVLVAARRIHPAALTALVMLLFGAWFFERRDDFAIFKIAMYVQPFFIASLALGAYGVLRMLGKQRPEWTAGAVAVAFSLVGIGAQQGYVEASRSLPSAARYTFSQVPLASARGLLEEFDSAARTVGHDPVAIDAPEPEFAKLAEAYFSDAPVATLSDDFLNRFRSDRPIYGVPDADYAHHTAAIEVEEFHEREQLADLFIPPQFSVDGTPNRFRVPWMPAGKPRWLLEMGADASILNRSGDAAPEKLVALRPWDSVHNHLVLMQTEVFGVDGYSGSWEDGAPGGKPTFFRPEHDEYGQRTFAGLGRFQTFEAINPSTAVRLVVWASATLKGDGKNRVPHGRVFGAENVPLAGVGRGSARLVTEPFEPASVDGVSLIGLDLGEDGVRFRRHASGLMRWFGTDISVDPRPLVVFGRDISLISDADYRNWNPPGWVSDLPAALDDPHLEYSGIYEDDGWVSDDVELTLRSDAATHGVRVQGAIPDLGSAGFSTTATLSVDGREVLSKPLGVGAFVLQTQLSLEPGNHKIGLSFSKAQRFAQPDGRIVGAQVDAIGFPP